MFIVRAKNEKRTKHKSARRIKQEIIKMNLTRIIGLGCFLLPFSVHWNVAYGYSYTGERSIRNSVLNSFAYDRMARPNDSTEISAGYNLLVINDLDIDRQEFVTTGWFTIIWFDERLRWTPSSYDDTNYIHALETEIWKPEVIVSNAQADVGLISDDHLIYRIHYDGIVEWEPLISTVVECSIDVTYFPFDKQVCQIELTSWGLPNTELHLEPLWTGIKLDEYRQSSSWDLEATSVEKASVMETVYNHVEYFSKIKFNCHMKRKPGNYVYNTIVPIIVSSFMMSVSNIVPIKSGERLSSGYLVLVINTLLLTIYVQQIPDIAITTSILGIYLTTLFCMDCVQVAITVCLVKLYLRPKLFPVPFCVRYFITGLRLFLLVRRTERDTEEDRTPPSPGIKIPTDDLKKVEKPTSMKKGAVHPIDADDGFTNQVKLTDQNLPPITAMYDIDLRQTRRKMRDLPESYYCDEIDQPRSRTKYCNNCKPNTSVTWHLVAFTLDRLVFFLFLIIKIVFNIVQIGTLFTGDETVY